MGRLREELMARFADNRLLETVEIPPQDLARWKEVAKSIGYKFSAKTKAKIWTPFGLAPLPKKGDFDIQVALASPKHTASPKMMGASKPNANLGKAKAETGKATSKNKRKKNKKKEGSAGGSEAVPAANPHGTTFNTLGEPKDDIWAIEDENERQRIRDFWVGLSETERRALVAPNGHPSISIPVPPLTAEEDEDDIDDDISDYDESESDQPSEDSGMAEFGTSLTVQGGILTVADDFLKNDGRKFLDLMEHLAQRKLRAPGPPDDPNEDWDDYDDESSNSEEYEDEDEPHLSEHQRMEEGRKMFQIFAAKMFEQRVLAAYREKAALDRAAKLVQELEEEENQKKLMEEAKKQKQKQEKERQRAAKLKAEQEKAALEEKRIKEEAEKARLKEEQRQKQIEASRLREEARQAEKARQEAKQLEKQKQKERQRALQEEKARKEAEERARKETEERERRQEKDRKKAEAAARKEAEAVAKREAEARLRQEAAERLQLEHEQKLAEEQARKQLEDQQAKSRAVADGHAKKLKQRLETRAVREQIPRKLLGETNAAIPHPASDGGLYSPGIQIAAVPL
ncbi:hypothetical protein HDU91_000906, partial [Kappamyces sp. JEL0680]